MRSSIAFASDSRNSRPQTLGPPERDEVVFGACLEGSGDANRANVSANPTEGIRAAIPRARRKSNDDVHTPKFYRFVDSLKTIDAKLDRIRF